MYLPEETCSLSDTAKIGQEKNKIKFKYLNFCSLPDNTCFILRRKNVHVGLALEYLTTFPDISILIEYTICQTRYLPSSAISMGFGVGWQYQHYGCLWCLVELHILQSMFRRENCLDSVMVDSFLGVMKSGLFYAGKIESVENFTKVFR